MRLAAEHHLHLGRPEQPARLDVPAGPAQQRRPAPRPARVKFAIVAPVVKPTPASAGSPSSSRSQPAATSSAAAAAGVGSAKPPICPQAEVSQSAATPAGCEAPITQPWKVGATHADQPALGAAHQLRDHRRPPAARPPAAARRKPASASA